MVINLKYPQPLSLSWRRAHGFAYLIGGVTFLIGSIMYFPAVSDYVAGGWCFTIGSFTFLFADLFEWWMNNRVGCFMDAAYRKDYEEKCTEGMRPANTTGGMWDRAVNGVNFFYSALGSFLYLWGSIYFIPSLNVIVQGTWIFIFGSVIIFTSQSWKLSRYTWSDDYPAAGVDLGACIGGLFYLLGSIMFLPAEDSTDVATMAAATLFTMGGLCFFLSGVFMEYRYFCAPGHEGEFCGDVAELEDASNPMKGGV
jgi:hypothetical protein